MKDIEKYIGYYLLVYISVLALFGFFQYVAVCQGESLKCAFSVDGVNEIITTTAYVLTPIVAIIGFQSWRHQETYKKSLEILILIMDRIRDLHITWEESRKFSDISRFTNYCMKDLKLEELDNLDIYENELSRIHSVLTVFYEINFLLDKLKVYKNLDLTQIDKALNTVEDLLNQTIDQHYKFHQQLISIRYDSEFRLLSEEDMFNVCNVLDQYCHILLANSPNHKNYEDYSAVIYKHIQKIAEELLKIKKYI